MKIAITKNEFNLILKKQNHPVFLLDDDSQEIIEKQSGSDILYRYKIKDISTNKEYFMEVVFNSSYEDFHDEPQGGDFYIDKEKKDSYDKHGNPLTEKNNIEEKKENLNPTQTIINQYNQLKEKDLIQSCDLNLVLKTFTTDEIVTVFGMAFDIVVVNKKTSTFADCTNFQNEFIRPLALKYQFNLQDLFHVTWQGVISYAKVNKIRSKNIAIQHYLLNKEILDTGGLTLNINKKDVFFDKATLNVIKKLPL